MNQILQEKLVILLNKICIEKIKDSISILNINGNEELI